MTVRVTQGAVIVGHVGAGNVRVTQGALIVGVKLAAVGVRATQAQLIVGYTADLSVRVTQAQLIVGVKTQTPPCLTQECDLWRIERTDGVVYRFTSHDRPVTFRGESYTPCESLTPSALQLSSELGSTDNLDITGLVSTSRIAEVDLWAGRFEGASVEVWRAPWGGTTPARLVAAGNCGALDYDDTTYRFEVVTAGQRLQQRPILKPCMPTCRFKLGDGRCPVDLPALAETGTVTSVSSVNVFTGAHRREFRDSGRTEDADHFTLGRLTWTNGDNSGIGTDVKSHAADGTFELEMPLPYPVKVGDTYSVTPGCDRKIATCADKFGSETDNGEKFGGFPYLKGEDDLNKVGS